MQVSGKLVILSILALAITAAGASWWFRYASTHRAAQFWGPKNSALIRDAPIVQLYEWRRLPDSAFRSDASAIDFETAAGRDISQARGLVHLRTALLADSSYVWPAEKAVPGSWQWALVFRDANRNQSAMLLFSSRWDYVGGVKSDGILSTEPIAAGLKQFFTDLSPQDAAEAR